MFDATTTTDVIHALATNVDATGRSRFSSCFSLQFPPHLVVFTDSNLYAVLDKVGLPLFLSILSQ